MGISQPVQAQASDLTIQKTTMEGKSISTPDPHILFQDDFNDGNADGWTTYGLGTWSVNNGEYVVDMGSGSSRLGSALAGDTNWTDYIFDVDMKADLGAGKAVCFRCNVVVGAVVGYYVNIVGNPYNVFILGKTGNNLVSFYYPSTTGIWYHVKVVIMGANIIVYVNDQLMINYTDNNADRITHGGIGLNGWTGDEQFDVVRYDNVVVRAANYIYIPIIIRP
jgi:hypothetical protein